MCEQGLAKPNESEVCIIVRPPAQAVEIHVFLYWLRLSLVAYHSTNCGIIYAMTHRDPIDENVLRRLYVKERRSSAEIAKVLGCSEHKVNYWLEKHVISKRSISEAIYVKRNPSGDPFVFKAPRTIKGARLLGLGLGLYWGEGNKKNKNSLRLGNTDPALITSFLEFLEEIFNIDKTRLKFGLQIFSDMPKEKTLRFWLDQLKNFSVSRNQFFKITVTPYRGIGNYREKSKYGVLTVHFSNSKLKRLVDSMLPL